MVTDKIYRHDGYIGMMEACRSGTHDLDSFLNKPLFEIPLLTRAINLISSLPITSRIYATAAVAATDAWILFSIGRIIRRGGGFRRYFIDNCIRTRFMPRVQQVNYMIIAMTMTMLNYKVTDKEFHRPLDVQRDFTKECLKMVSENYTGVHASVHYHT